jgi:hypothetical protein
LSHARQEAGPEFLAVMEDAFAAECQRYQDLAATSEEYALIAALVGQNVLFHVKQLTHC